MKKERLRWLVQRGWCGRRVSNTRQQDNLARQHVARKKTNRASNSRRNCRVSCVNPESTRDHGNALQIKFYRALMQFVCARRVGWNISRRIAGLDDFVFDEIAFYFFAADVRQHL